VCLYSSHLCDGSPAKPSAGREKKQSSGAVVERRCFVGVYPTMALQNSHWLLIVLMSIWSSSSFGQMFSSGFQEAQNRDVDFVIASWQGSFPANVGQLSCGARCATNATCVGYSIRSLDNNTVLCRTSSVLNNQTQQNGSQIFWKTTCKFSTLFKPTN
jgi:hypothetical protein